MNHLLAEYQALSAETGIALPPLLQSLIAHGRTQYGLDWSSTWRERSLRDPPAFISWYDHEWIDGAASRACIADWLHPDHQDGRRFLPFAETGAGDAWCLMPIDGHAVGVALVRHDDGSGELCYASFDDFVCTRFVELFADMNHLVRYDAYTPQEAYQVVCADVMQVTALMQDEAQGAWLRQWCRPTPMLREVGQGRCRAQVLSLLTEAQRDAHLGRFRTPGLAPFPVVPRWETQQPEPAAPRPDWRALARDPAQKRAAIQAYRARNGEAFGSSLAEAKAAVERELQEASVTLHPPEP